MARRAPPRDPAYRRRRARDTAAWRSRQRRGVELFKVECGRLEYDFMVRFAGLREDRTTNKAAASAALGRLLRMGLIALLERSKKV